MKPSLVKDSGLLSATLEVDREIGRKSLRDYLEMAWPQIEPKRAFIPNYHIDAICDHLEAVTRGEIRRLVINVPPGTSKSITCSVAWPSWVWTHTPEAKWITASFSGIVSRRDALRARQLMEGNWYQERWGRDWEPDKDSWSSMSYRNSKAGFRLAVTVGGGVTGEHADHQLVDDPIKPLDARGARVDSTKLQICKEWWDETMATRVVDPATATRTIIMQRLHDQDLSGYVLATGDYVHLNLPMRYEPRCAVTVKHSCSLKEDGKGRATEPTPLRTEAHPKGFKDHREEGDLLWPERFPEKIQSERKKEMGSRGVAAQDQQRPMPSGGGIFKREWVKFWKVRPKGTGVEMIQSWDCAFKGLDDSDYVVGQVWARRGGEYFLMDQTRDQMSVAPTCRAVQTMASKWPKAIRKLVEDKANGPAVMQILEEKVSGLKAVNPEGGKISRAQAVEPLWEAGNVWLPSPEMAPWVHDFIEELVDFNGDPGRPDDQVDAMTQALVYFSTKSTSTYKKAMENVG